MGLANSLRIRCASVVIVSVPSVIWYVLVIGPAGVGMCVLYSFSRYV